MALRFALALVLGTAITAILSLHDAADAKAILLYKFKGGTDGDTPMGPLIADAAGNLYGTTSYGGGAGVGTVFSLSPGNGGSWTETVLHAFNGTDGSYPNGGLFLDANGNLYGTTFGGGPGRGGVAFELSPAKNGTWIYSQIDNFGNAGSSGGSEPNGSLVSDGAGNLYGTTLLGGSGTCSNFPGPCGVVFELSPGGQGTWTETVLYSFAGVPDGEFPAAGVVLDAGGRVYGSTSQGGTGKCNDGEGTIIGCGTVFSLQQQGSAWSETQLYNFRKNEQGEPGGAPLVFSGNGALFGTAGYDVFRLKPPRSGTNWTKQTIYEFTEGIAGTIPSGGPAFDTHGRLYLTTASSGLDGFSTASQLSPPTIQGDPWTQKTLAQFGGDFKANQPRGGLLVAGDGTLYGTVSGSPGYIFAIQR